MNITQTFHPALEFIRLNWGLIDYQVALQKQLELVEALSVTQAKADDASPHPTPAGYFVFCTHPPVVTRGRKTLAEDVTSAWQGPQVEVARGGRATYHGPSQVIVYPILNLERITPKRDVVMVIRNMEKALVNTLADYQITAQGKTASLKTTGLEDTGVWVDSTKVASIGIGVKNWISYHGLAVNLTSDPQAFVGLKPCGYEAQVMSSVEQILGYTVEREVFENRLEKYLRQVFQAEN